MLFSPFVTLCLLPTDKGCDKINSIYLRADSQIAICWIKSHSSRGTMFVANRIYKIQTYWVDLYPEKLINNNFWWHGPPSFLHDPTVTFSTIDSTIHLDKIPEQNRKVQVLHIADEYNCYENILQVFKLH